jgi:tetratricopeptide (TPR) repeat protein
VDGDVARRALHLAEAAIEPDEEVATALDQAGRYCLHRGNSDAAVQALTRAARLSPSPQDRNRRLAEASYVGADVTGELQGALARLAQAHSGAIELPQSMAAVLATSCVLLNADCDIDAGRGLLAGALAAHAGAFIAADEHLVAS